MNKFISTTLSLFIATQAILGGIILTTPDVQALSPVACTIDRISLSNEHSLLKVNNEIYVHKTVHKTQLNDWVLASDNKPWGTTEIKDFDLQEAPIPVANPLDPMAVVTAGNKVYLHNNLDLLTTNNWEDVSLNAPWGVNVLIAVGMTTVSNTTKDVSIVVATNDNVYFKNYNSLVWVDITGTKPWGVYGIKDIDVGRNGLGSNLSLVSKNGSQYQSSNNGWILMPNQIMNAERIDSEFRAGMVSVGPNAYYSRAPLFNGYPYSSVNDNQPWGTKEIDDIALYFWTQEEPWNTPAIIQVLAGNVPYLHWHPQSLGDSDWIDVSDNKPWLLAGQTCGQPLTTISLQKSIPANQSTVVVLNQNITYNVTVKNTGTSVAYNAVITDILPQNYNFVTALSSPKCALTNRTITCNEPQIAAGQSVVYPIVITPVHVSLCETTIVNTATVTGHNFTSASANAEPIKVVCPVKDVSITKVAAGIKRAYTLGETIPYTLTVSNLGNTTVDLATVTDGVKPGFTFVASQSDARCQLVNTTVTCAVTNLNSLSGVSLPVAFKAETSAACGSFVNTADVTAAGDEISANNRSSAEAVTVTCPVPTADLKLTKSTTKTSVTPNEAITYTLSVLNQGENTAENIIVTDTVPSNLTYNGTGSTSGCTLSGSVVSCSLGGLLKNDTKQVQLAFTVQNNTCGQTVTNTATVTSTTQDTNLANNTSTVTTPVQCANGLAISKTDNRTTAKPGDTLSYTITVTNSGALAATGTTVVDTLPSELTFVSAGNLNGISPVASGQTVTWATGTLAAGSTITTTVTATVKSTVATNTVVRNRVQIGTISAEDTTTIVRDAEPAAVSISISDDPTVLDIFCDEDEIEYRITVRNTGSVDGSFNIVAELDDGMEFIEASDDGDESGDEVEWDDIDVDANDSEVLTLRVRIDEDEYEEGDRVRLVVKSGTVTDTEDTTIGDEDCTSGGGSNDDVSIEKSASRSEVLSGDTIRYTITVRNNSSKKVNITVRDYMEGASDVQFSNYGSAKRKSNGLYWDLNIPARGSETLRYDARTRAGFTGTLYNTAEIVGGDSDSATVRVIGNLPVTGSAELRNTDDDTTALSLVQDAATNEVGGVLPGVFALLSVGGLAVGTRFGKKLL